MNVILKILVTIGILLYIKSCVTKTTMAHLPDELPTDLPKVDLSKVDLSKIDLPEILKPKTEETKKEPADTTERVEFAHKQRVRKDPDCVEVSKPFGKSMVADASDIKHMEKPSQWMVTNNSAETLAIVIEQREKVVAVAYVGPLQHYKAKIPSEEISLSVKYTGNSCINWKSPGGVKSRVPMVPPDQAKRNQAKTAIMKTTITSTSSGIDVETKLNGFESSDGGN
jgi:hypothetical protein